MSARRPLPPRLVTRVLATASLTVALLLGGVFVLVSLETRTRVRESVAANLDAGQELFARIENRLETERFAAVATLAENPTLKAALDTWQAERRAGGGVGQELIAMIQLEVDKIATRVHADVLAVTDASGAIVVSAGSNAGAWSRGTRVQGAGTARAQVAESIVTLDRRVYRVKGVPLWVGDTVIGSLELGRALDEGFARDLAALARAHSAIVVGDRVEATTLPAPLAGELTAASLSSGSVMTLVEQTWAVRRVGGSGPATFYALGSVDTAAQRATWSALKGLAWIGGVAIVFGMVGSLWLARTLTRPIETLSASLTEMTAAKTFDHLIPAPGSSRELDALAGTFNALIRSLADAQAETQSAYLSAIRALAAALDARDPYTSGHSERVSALSVEIGRAMRLPDEDVTVLRLGALLHDIGKIGVPDEILRKQGALTASEFELIRQHPVIGARILRTLPFLAAHLPIVELHHERPDGQGYPYGLSGDAIPLTARIVHVADAFDAMTSARAYRPGRLPHEALAELRRGAGTDFDPASVEALASAVPRLPAAFGVFDSTAFQLAAMQRTHVS